MNVSLGMVLMGMSCGSVEVDVDGGEWILSQAGRNVFITFKAICFPALPHSRSYSDM